MDLYHADLGIPQHINLEFACYLNYTLHAREAAKSDRYGPINLPTVFDTRNATLIEVGVENGSVVKAMYRQHYDNRHDLCLVINLKANKVVTVWLNEKNDNHKTLDASKYVKA